MISKEFSPHVSELADNLTSKADVEIASEKEVKIVFFFVRLWRCHSYVGKLRSCAVGPKLFVSNNSKNEDISLFSNGNTYHGKTAWRLLLDRHLSSRETAVWQLSAPSIDRQSRLAFLLNSSWVMWPNHPNLSKAALDTHCCLLFYFLLLFFLNDHYHFSSIAYRLVILKKIDIILLCSCCMRHSSYFTF